MKTYKIIVKVDDRNEFQSHGQNLTKPVIDLLEKYYGGPEEFIDELWTQQFVEAFNWRNVLSGVIGVDLTKSTTKKQVRQKLREN